MNIAEVFSKRLASLRKERGFRTEELSKIVHLSPRTITMLENGQRNPTVPEVVAFGKFFNVSFDYLLGKSDDRIGREFMDKAGGNLPLAAIMQYMSSLSEEEAEAVFQKLSELDQTSLEK